jgi:hypothetical protein
MTEPADAWVAAEMMGEDDPRVVAWDALVAGQSPL